MNRAYSILNIKAVKEDERIIEGIASTPSPDRMGDVVDPMGAQFKLPLPLLWQHNSREPIGEVFFAKPNKDGIPFKAKIVQTLEPGRLKDRLDEAWQSIKLGLVRAVSIGFTINAYEILKEGGWRINEWEWLELSAVTIPAQSEATINVVKSIDAPLLAASGFAQKGNERTVKAGVTASRSTHAVKAMEAKTMKKTIAEQIAAFEATRQAKAAEMDTLMDVCAEKGETLDAAGKETYDTLKDEVKEIDEHLVRLKDMQTRNVAKAAPVAGDTAEAAAASRRGTSPIVSVRNAAPKGIGFVRLLAARFMAKEDGVSPADIAHSKGWGDDIVSVLKMPKSIIQKAAIAPANTTDSTWAGPLVVYENLQGEFIELLRPKSILERIPGLRRVPFNIKVPRETAPTTGYWVGQGSPKPVSKGALDTVTLDFAKVAGITYQTQELLRFSQPNSEQLMINSLVKAITYLVDRDFLDPAKAVATGVSPASITNGATSITATGTTADAFRADFAALLTLYAQANYNLDGLVVVMTQSQALKLGLMRNDFGSKEFPDINKDGGFIEGVPVITSENIVANGGSPADGSIIVALNANDILLADDGAVDVDVSTEASIQAESAPDSPTTASTVLISLWQNNLVGIRCERFVTWQKAKTDSVLYITGGNYR